MLLSMCKKYPIMLKMSYVGEILAKNLKHLRKQKGWNQLELAENSGYSLENIKKLETVGTWISADGVTKLSKAFGCSEAELFSDRETGPLPTLSEALTALTKAVELLSMIPSNAMEALSHVDWNNPKALELLKVNLAPLQKQVKIKKNTA